MIEVYQDLLFYVFLVYIWDQLLVFFIKNIFLILALARKASVLNSNYVSYGRPSTTTQSTSR